ncbi:SIR2 family protein [Microbacterium sp. NPDC077057]|uniref:SIR2 family protein n=1 Tax=Microbacterium sp. NPDC077057 TaxID=3154763 RepID=UPI00344391C7
MTFAEELVAHLNRLPAAPFLFVGSGFSRRYVGADDWAGLLRRFTEPAGNTYERYASAANGSFPQIATLIADDFHDVWWDSPEYAAQRAVHPSPKGRSSPLKIAIADYLGDVKSQLPVSGDLAKELDLLRKSTIEGVITTNYDELLEQLFPDFAVFAGQDELLFHEPQGVGEIYKIHGSAAKPESLVVDSDDYERFTRRNAYLAAKLLTIFVEHPVIFIGYSLTDDDVREILTSIAHVLTNENLSKLQDRLIFIQWDPAALEPRLIPSPFATDGMAIPMMSATVSDYAELFDALGSLTRRFPTKFLRRLKEQVYELVQTSEPKGKLFVMDIDAEVDTTDVEMVIGVGIHDRLAAQGIVGLGRRDLQRDVLDSKLPAHDRDTMVQVVRQVLPRLLVGRANTPIYRYLRGAGLLTDSGDLADGADLPEAVRARFDLGASALRAPAAYVRRALTQVREAGSFAELVANCTMDDVLFAAPHMPAEKIDLGDLRQFLIEVEEAALSGNSLQSTQWGKCLCFYDLLANKSATSA